MLVKLDPSFEKLSSEDQKQVVEYLLSHPPNSQPKSIPGFIPDPPKSHLFDVSLGSAVGLACGLCAGIVLWLFYRLVRFAVKG